MDEPFDLATFVVENRNARTMRELADWVDDDSERFATAWEIMENGEARASECASWMIYHCLERWPNLLSPWQQNAYSMLKKPYHDAVYRCLTKGLTNIEIEEDLHMPLFDVALGLVENKTVATGIRSFSIYLAWSIIEPYPDLHPELEMALETNFPTGTAAFRSRARKILDRIAELRDSGF